MRRDFALDLLDIGTSPEVTLADIFKVDDRARVVLGPPGDIVEHPRELWPTPSLEQIVPNAAPELVAHAVRDVLIHGPGIVERGGRALVCSDAFPPYVAKSLSEGYYWKSAACPPAMSRTFQPRRLRACFIVEHFMRHVYGHALLEIIPKLFMVNALRRLGLDLPIVMQAGHPQWLATIARLICPHSEFVTYDPSSEAVRADVAVLLPWCSGDYAMHPSARQMFQSLGGKARSKKGLPAVRLFLLREGRPSYRFLENESQLAQIATEFGFKAIRPEAFSWLDQAALFNAAEIVVGEFTSALHNTVFSPAGTRVVPLNRVNGLQDLIAGAFRHEIGYVLPEDGKPVLFEFGNTAQRRYRVSAVEFRERVEWLCGAGRKTPLQL